MKRILPLILSLLLLFLCGCRHSSGQQVQKLTGDPDRDPTRWMIFYYSPILSPDEEASIRLLNSTTLHWDGSEYHITDKSGTRSYGYLHEFVDIQETAGGWDYHNEYVLTDKAELTLAEFQASGDGEVVYSDSFYCESAAVFGDVPNAVTDLIDRRMKDLILPAYLPGSVFERTISGYMESREEWIRRWSYSGELLCEFHVDGYAECFAELEDGGFITNLHNYADNTYQINCYNSDGSTRWTVPLGDSDLPYVFQFLITKDGIYGFGHIRREDSFQDVYICRISSDGELLQEACLGGTDYDTVDWVEVSANGFTIYGSTQSDDGDFPLSEDGYGVDFLLDLSCDLEIRSVRQDQREYSYYRLEGYLDGQPVFFKDPILTVSKKDTLPIDNIYTIGVFQQEDGYVILRKYAFGNYPYKDPYMSSSMSYSQIIATGYDEEGTPLWQTVSKPFIS